MRAILADQDWALLIFFNFFQAHVKKLLQIRSKMDLTIFESLLNSFRVKKIFLFYNFITKIKNQKCNTVRQKSLYMTCLIT